MKRCLAFLLFYLSIVCATGQTPEKYNRLIDSFKRNGQGEKLIPWFVKEVKNRPGNEYALKALGSLYFERNDLEHGEKCYRDAIRINPLCARCYMSLGIACIVRKENKQALEYLNKAVAFDPGDAYIYSVRANLNELMGNKQEALFDFNMAVYIDARNADYYIQRGGFNGKEGYFYLALSDLNKATELAPGNYLAYFMRADVYFGKKMFKEALADISKAITLDSTHAFLYSARGNFNSEINEFGKAIADYTQAMVLDPQDYHLPYNRALCRYAQEDMDGYCADIRTCYDVLLHTAPADSLKIQLENAMATYCDPVKENYYYHRGIALFNQRRYNEAIAVYGEAIKRFPANALMYSFRGNAWLVLKEYAKALNDYQQAVKNRNNILSDLRETNIKLLSVDTYVAGLFATAHLSMAQCEFSLGHYDDALADIDTGLALAPVMKDFGRENYFNLRGIILITMGRQREAITDFDSCLRLNPRFETAWINRAVARLNTGTGTQVLENKLKQDESLAVRVNWALPEKKPRKGETEQMLQAMEDCNQAIQLDAQDGYAWYVRGRLGKLLGYGNYCADLVKAKGLGLMAEQKFISECGE